ncbi:hypothetical protein PK35_15475 [Tamlana nanhaiensis]|uniref:HTH cro/C1-type domain-containing protein n=1 Tax=Neotamlana nanhaiensis TaxID=1382798 RepID=A0A0D7VWJ9_9FLAO|nr:helix-turn-helix transcriptional regulator [Tamlana nanhaiensis]KJD31235.1 hypothetical protein PK35_15475 [Tamlana nanhaiensis]
MSIDSKKILTYQKEFGKQLKKIRLSKKMSQLDLAASCDLEKTSISRIENGRTNTTLKTMIIISEALNVNIYELFDFEI